MKYSSNWHKLNIKFLSWVPNAYTCEYLCETHFCSLSSQHFNEFIVGLGFVVFIYFFSSLFCALWLLQGAIWNQRVNHSWQLTPIQLWTADLHGVSDNQSVLSMSEMDFLEGTFNGYPTLLWKFLGQIISMDVYFIFY